MSKQGLKLPFEKGLRLAGSHQDVVMCLTWFSYAIIIYAQKNKTLNTPQTELKMHNREHRQSSRDKAGIRPLFIGDCKGRALSY
jgi:hypothetical protein